MDHIATEAALTARNKIISISAITAMPALQIQYIGALTYAKYKVVTTVLTLYADDTDGATTAVLTADTHATGYDTFGELVDAINATGVFRAYLIGARRNDDSDTMLDAVAVTSVKTDHGATVYFEQGTAAQVYGFGITNQKFLYRPTGGWATFEKGWVKDTNAINSIKNMSLELGESGTPGNGIWYIYANDDENKQDGVLVYSEAFVNDTAETHGMTVPDEIHWACPRGMRMSIQFLWTTSVNDYDAAIITATGHTEDVAGGQVPSDNYTGSV